MHINARGGPLTYSERDDAHLFQPYLNGARVEQCVEADDEEGYVLISRGWKSIPMDVRLRGEPPVVEHLERLEGQVWLVGPGYHTPGMPPEIVALHRF